MTADEFRDAFKDTTIVVATRSGRLYYVHEDQTDGVQDDSLIYGSPVRRHLRDNNAVRWFKLRNLSIAKPDDQTST